MDRLEAALAARPAQTSTNPAPADEGKPSPEHARMQAEVVETLAALDELISGLEK